MAGVNKVYSFVVTLNADLRPLIGGLNRELESHGAEPVRKVELSEIDGMLQEVLGASASGVTHCPHCQGYVSIDLDGELTCLNCARPTTPRMELDDVIQQIAQRLIERRADHSSEAAGARLEGRPKDGVASVRRGTGVRARPLQE